MTEEDLTTDIVVSGPVLPEPAKVITYNPEGISFNLELRGINTGLLFHQVVDPFQFKKLKVLPIIDSGIDYRKRRSDPMQYFSDLIFAGLVDEAEEIQKKNHLYKKKVEPVVLEAFYYHKGKKNNRIAINIGLKYELGHNLIDPLFLSEWNRLIENEQYEEAAEWAKNQNLSNIEVYHSAILTYTTFLKKDRTEEALRIYFDYHIKREDVFEITLTHFNKSFKKREYLTAAILGKTFEFAFKRTSSAAVNAAIAALRDDKQDEFLGIIKKFEIYTDDVFNEISHGEAENFTKLLFDNLIQPCFRERNFKVLNTLVEKSAMLTTPYDNETLKLIVSKFIGHSVKVHNVLMQENKVKEARLFQKSFDLFSLPLSEKWYVSMVDEAITVHKKYLADNNFDGAIAIKNEYFAQTYRMDSNQKEAVINDSARFIIKSVERGDIESARKALYEYKIPSQLVDDAVLTAIFNLIKTKKYKTALAIVDDFDIKARDQKIEERLRSIYMYLLDVTEYLFAAELALISNLKKTHVEEAALRAWKGVFRDNQFDKAYEIKAKYKLHQKLTLKTATRKYWEYLDYKEIEYAVRIRKDYKVPLTFGQWLREMMRLIFNPNKTKTEEKTDRSK
ncbi:hypothetical protein ACFL7D_01720 [candidate division KSB1 bacterium]